MLAILYVQEEVSLYSELPHENGQDFLENMVQYTIYILIFSNHPGQIEWILCMQA